MKTLAGYALPIGLSVATALMAPTSALESKTTLPENVIIPLSVVNQFFPEVTHVVSTGWNSTAAGNPKATRSVIYANPDNSKKVTITVDQYASSSDSLSAYKRAVQKSKIPGMKVLPVPKLGQQAFAGTVTIGGETHVGLGMLDGELIVGATLAGYDATPDNVAKLIALSRKEDAAARARN